jgi:hypothetical protein
MPTARLPFAAPPRLRVVASLLLLPAVAHAQSPPAPIPDPARRAAALQFLAAAKSEKVTDDPLALSSNTDLAIAAALLADRATLADVLAAQPDPLAKLILHARIASAAASAGDTALANAALASAQADLPDAPTAADDSLGLRPLALVFLAQTHIRLGDLPAALRLADSLPHAPEQARILADIAAAQAAKDPAVAADTFLRARSVLLTLPPDVLTTWNYQELAYAQARAGDGAARGTCALIPDPLERTEALVSIADAFPDPAGPDTREAFLAAQKSLRQFLPNPRTDWRLAQAHIALAAVALRLHDQQAAANALQQAHSLAANAANAPLLLLDLSHAYALASDAPAADRLRREADAAAEKLSSEEHAYTLWLFAERHARAKELPAAIACATAAAKGPPLDPMEAGFITANVARQIADQSPLPDLVANLAWIRTLPPGPTRRASLAAAAHALALPPPRSP